MDKYVRVILLLNYIYYFYIVVLLIVKNWNSKLLYVYKYILSFIV